MNHIPQVEVPEIRSAAVYGSLNAQELGIGELHVADVEANIPATVVSEHVGAAMLNAENYVDPAQRGVLQARHGNQAEIAAAQERAVQASLSELFGDVDADENESESVNA